MILKIFSFFLDVILYSVQIKKLIYFITSLKILKYALQDLIIYSNPTSVGIYYFATELELSRWRADV